MSQEILKVLFSLHSLHKIYWRNLLGLFHQFFVYVLKAAYNGSCDIVLLSQFLMRRIEEADRPLAAFVAEDTRYNFNEPIISE